MSVYYEWFHHVGSVVDLRQLTRKHIILREMMNPELQTFKTFGIAGSHRDGFAVVRDWK